MRTIPFKRRIIAPSVRITPEVTPKKEGFTMANFAKLLTDVPAELTAVQAFVKGIEKCVSDAKASGLSTVEISDIEALAPEGETVVQDTENIINDLGGNVKL